MHELSTINNAPPGPDTERVRRFLYSLEAVRLIRLIGGSDVPVALVKGPALGEIAYGGVENRPFNDIDLFIRHSDISRVVPILEKVGYVLQSPVPRDIIDTYGNGPPVHPVPNALSFGKESGAFVDLHPSLVPQDLAGIFDDERMWGRMEKVEILGTPVMTPGAVDMLHFLAYHGLSHLWGEERLVRDFALYAQLRGDDRIWREAVETAGERGFLVMFLTAVQLAVWYENLEVPGFVGRLLARKKRVQGMASRYGRQLESDGEGKNTALKTVLSRRYVWDSGRDRLQWFFRLLFTPNVYDHAWIRLPPAMGPAYYLLRPLRLMWRSTFSRLDLKRNAC